ncbi:MAG TPA: aminotransferase class V-fold PLP-dependent enzyme [Solirubrobacteraceae bacterium]|nr:aminotransferase class V-fold PLP-dependent enzyme [Solirubrobacteraceae bacterium]
MRPLRDEFPLLATRAYLNAGTDGPIPAVAVQAARDALETELVEGRVRAHFEARTDLRSRLRTGYARVLGAAEHDVALTSSTSEGVARALSSLGVAQGDEILTSDEEHPGLIGPLVAARERGAAIRVVPFDELADAVGPSTTVVACSHVSWVRGRFAPVALGAAARDAGALLLLDGAQGVGAVPVDVTGLGCHFYAGSGQKWLCGPDGTGMLWVDPGVRARCAPPDPSYSAFADPAAGLDAALHPDARALDGPGLSREGLAFALASLEVLEREGLAKVHARARALAASLAERLQRAGRRIAPRDATTLVAWHEEDAEGVRDHLAAAGVFLRDLPGRGLVRASVGAWNDEDDLDRLLAAL